MDDVEAVRRGNGSAERDLGDRRGGAGGGTGGGGGGGSGSGGQTGDTNSDLYATVGDKVVQRMMPGREYRFTDFQVFPGDLIKVRDWREKGALLIDRWISCIVEEISLFSLRLFSFRSISLLGYFNFRLANQPVPSTWSWFRLVIVGSGRSVAKKADGTRERQRND